MYDVESADVFSTKQVYGVAAVVNREMRVQILLSVILDFVFVFYFLNYFFTFFLRKILADSDCTKMFRVFEVRNSKLKKL